MGVKGSARKTNCACCFFFFSDDLQSTANPRKPRSPHVGCVRYARTRSPFSLQPQPTACVPCGTHPTDGFKGRLKKRSRRLFHLPCDKRLPEKFLLLMFRAFFFRRPVILESAATCPLPRGGGLGRGHSPNFGNLSQSPNHLNTSLAACCPLSNSLPQGERTGRLLGVKGSARKTGCAGCFLLFRRPAINGCKSKLLFKPPATAKSAAIRSLPCGGGLGRGHSPSCGNLSQYPNRLKYKPCGLLPSL